MKRLELIHRLLQRSGGSRYLEIGCNTDRTFNAVQAERKVGVDPVRGGTVRATSDEFFAENSETFDVVFIDGLHLHEQVLRDVAHALKCLSSSGSIVLHDCLPTCREHQERERRTRTWNGDVWRAVVELRKSPDIDLAVIDDDHGLGVILPRANTKPLHRECVEWEDYERDRNQLMRVEHLDQFLTGWFEHFLVTRFSCRNPGAQWLEHRVQVFREFCLPGVLGQTCSRFRWLLLCDRSTPDCYIAELAAIPGAEVVWSGEGRSGLTEALHVARRSESEWIVTTRLDNDDAIHERFVEEIQQLARPEAEWLNPASGYWWDRGRVARADDNIGSPFLSRVERTRVAQGVYSTQHRRCSEAGPVRHYAVGAPRWIRVVHGFNLLNRAPHDIGTRWTAEAPAGFRLPVEFSLPVGNRLAVDHPATAPNDSGKQSGQC